MSGFVRNILLAMYACICVGNPNEVVPPSNIDRDISRPVNSARDIFATPCKPFPWTPSDPRSFVPKIVWQTWKNATVPPRFQKIRERSIRRNPEWSFKLVSDEEGDNLIRQHFKGRVSEGYFRIRREVGAARADILRLCLLFLFGGVYIDLDAEILTPLSLWVRDNDTALLSREGLQLDNNLICPPVDRQKLQTHFVIKETVLQSAIIFGPRHPILAHIIERITSNLHSPENLNCSMHNKVISTTGPVAVTLALNSILIGSNKRLKWAFHSIRWDHDPGHREFGPDWFRQKAVPGVNYGNKIRSKAIQRVAYNSSHSNKNHVGNSYGVEDMNTRAFLFTNAKLI